MKLVYLQRDAEQLPDLSAQGAEILTDADELLGRLRERPDEVGWVLIASDWPGAGSLADRVQAAHPAVHVMLAGAGDAESPSEPAMPAGSVMRQTLERLGGIESELRDARRREYDEERLSSMALLTAGIAHDVGTPITAILGYAELIARSAPDEKNRKRATTIMEQVGRVRGLIETLMQIARSEDRQREPVDMVLVIERALDSRRPGLEAAGIAVEREFGTVPLVEGDAARLQQTFENLFQNAVEAMERGGTLRVILREAPPSGVEARIADSGVGIEAGIRRRIFEPYFTTRQSSKGLGLLVARTIVNEHGGSIALMEDAGEGTEFCVTLPGIQNGTEVS